MEIKVIPHRRTTYVLKPAESCTEGFYMDISEDLERRYLMAEAEFDKVTYEVFLELDSQIVKRLKEIAS